jgi:methionyl-tRNA formyltransferase
MPLNIVFMGTPEFAVPALQALLDSEHRVVAVYAQPPRPAGRGQKLRESPTHQLAETYAVDVCTPRHFKTPESLAELKSYQADIAVVAAYGLLLPAAVLEAFPKGCINIHPSALPRWRGAAPIHRTVLAGDKSTDICIMQMDEGLDTGAVLAREPVAIPREVTTGQLHDMLATQAVPLLLETLSAIEAGGVKAIPQSGEGITYAHKIRKEEAEIDWTHSAEEIARKIRGLNPFPVAASTLNGEPIRILEATWDAEGHSVIAGTTINDQFSIACGFGTLHPTRVQRPGKKPLLTQEMLRGYPVPQGTRLGTRLGG